MPHLVPLVSVPHTPTYNLPHVYFVPQFKHVFDWYVDTVDQSAYNESKVEHTAYLITNYKNNLVQNMNFSKLTKQLHTV